MFRVEQIASEAGVSPRTFNNYFSSKEEAILAIASQQAEKLHAALAERPAEPVWQSLTRCVTVLYPDRPDRTWLSRARMVKTEPALEAARLRSDAELERTLAGEIARRTRLDARRNLYPRLAASVMIAAVHAALDHWLERPGKEGLHATLIAAMERCGAGLDMSRRRGVRDRRLTDR